MQLPIPESQWLVSDLKFALFEHTCVLPSLIVLRKDGIEMQNDDFVSQYKVVEESVILMELLGMLEKKKLFAMYFFNFLIPR